jgi:hypothetical protein
LGRGGAGFFRRPTFTQRPDNAIASCRRDIFFLDDWASSPQEFARKQLNLLSASGGNAEERLEARVGIERAPLFQTRNLQILQWREKHKVQLQRPPLGSRWIELVRRRVRKASLLEYLFLANRRDNRGDTGAGR